MTNNTQVKYFMPTFYLSHALAYLGEKMIEWACMVQGDGPYGPFETISDEELEKRLNEMKK